MMYDTLSGCKTHFGKPGSNVRYVQHMMEQDERIKQKYDRKKQRTLEEEKIKVTDQDIDDWVNMCYNICKDLNTDKPQEDEE